MTDEELPLFELYTRLREAGLPLGLKEYAQLLRALQAGFGVADQDALARLCAALWIKNEEESHIFSYHFAGVMREKPLSYSEVARKKEQKSKFSQEVAHTQKITEQNIRKAQKGIFAALVLLLLGLICLALMPKEQDILVGNTPQLEQEGIPQLPEVTQPKEPVLQSEAEQKMSAFLLVALPGSFLIGTGLSWLFIRNWTVLKEAQSADDEAGITAQISTINTKIAGTEIDEVQLAESLRQASGQATNMPNLKVLGQDEYFPLTRRQMKQGWRYLRRNSREGPKTELDIDGTVKQISHQGMFFKPVMMAARKNQTDLVFLIDQEGSMVPFQKLSQRLVDTATRAGQLGQASTYYFHNCPTRYLYCTPLMQHPETLSNFWTGRLSAKSVVVIVSDAGAARGGLNTVRIQKTQTFLEQLKQNARYAVWLNPLPKNRWHHTTAGEIARLITMFEINRPGFQGAIEVLRGRWKPNETEIRAIR